MSKGGNQVGVFLSNAIAAGVSQATRGYTRTRNTAQSAMRLRTGTAVNVSTDTKLIRTKKQVGKPVSKRQRLLKLMDSTAQTIVERFQRLQTLNAGSGVVPLDYIQTAVTGSNSYPLYAFDLFATYNQSTSIGNRDFNQQTNFPAVMYRLRRNYDSADSADLKNAYYFEPQASTCTGLLPDGATSTYTWCNEKQPKMRNSPCQAAHFDWLDFRFMFYAPTSQPVNVYFDLVRLKDDKFIDYYQYNSDSGTLTTVPTIGEQLYIRGSEDRAREWNEMWAGFVDRLITSPLNKRDAYNVGGIQIVSSQKIVFNPRNTDVSDTRGDKRMMQVFKNINRVVKYQWERTADFSKAGTVTTGFGISPIQENNPNVWDTNAPGPNQSISAADAVQTDCQVAPHPRNRLYLMVYAETPVTGAATTADNASFDFCIRRKRTIAV